MAEFTSLEVASHLSGRYKSSYSHGGESVNKEVEGGAEPGGGGGRVLFLDGPYSFLHLICCCVLGNEPVVCEQCNDPLCCEPRL